MSEPPAPLSTDERLWRKKPIPVAAFLWDGYIHPHLPPGTIHSIYEMLEGRVYGKIRSREGEPLQETDVYWPRGTPWVSAEPRKIEDWRIDSVISHALARWSTP